MTTLRDYILDCRCPNCGLTMQQQTKPKRSWTDLVTVVLIPILILLGTIDAWSGHYDHAAYDMTLAIFLRLTERRS
jgi:hypothetical protein